MRLGCVAFALSCGGPASAKQAIWLTAIQPFTGGEWDTGVSQSIGGKIMLEQVNAHSGLLRDFELKVVWQDGMCSAVEGTRIFHANVFERRYFAFAPNTSLGLADLDVDGDGVIEKEDTAPLGEEWDQSEVSPMPIGVLGPGCSSTSMSIAMVAYYTKVHVVSNSASFSPLSDRNLYPNFFRTILPDTFCSPAWVAMTVMLGQRSLVAVIGETPIWGAMAESMVRETEAAGVSLVGVDLSEEIPGFHGLQLSRNSVTSAREVATQLVKYRQRIVALLMFETRNRLVMCEAYKFGLRNAVFMPFGWLSRGWWNTSDTSCTPQQLTSMAQGFISAQMMYWRYDGDTALSCSETMTAKEFQEEWLRRQRATLGDHGLRPEGFYMAPEAATMADAVCMYARALDALLVGRGLSFHELIARTDRAYADLTELLQASDFEGVQGRVAFRPGSPDPEGSILLEQLHVDGGGGWMVVEIATSINGTLRFLGKADLIFGLPGEQVFAGPAGAAAISLDLTSFAACGRDQTLDMEQNRCVGCPVGKVYMDIVQNCVCRAGYTSSNGTCRECEAGTFAPSDGLAQCSRCPAGHFSSERASKACSGCPLGKFAEEEGSSDCTSCESEYGKDMTTQGPGTTSRAECRCGGDTFQDAESRECRGCLEGLECPFSSDMAPGASVAPRVLPSYWSDSREPLSIFRCESAHRCPGRHFGTCAPHTRGRACAHCKEGWTWDSVVCAPCSSLARSGLLFPVLPLLFVPVAVCGLYKLFGNQYAKWGSWQNGVTATVFILLNYVQIVALMQSIELNLPEAAVRFFRATAFANDLIEGFSPHCAGFSGFRALQAISVVTPAIVLLLAFFCWLAAQGLSRWTGCKWLAMERDRTWNVAMSLLYTFFTSIATVSCTLFKCGANPNGTQSLVADRTIICFQGEWLDLLPVEIVGISVWCFGVVCLFSRVVFFSSMRHFHRKGVQKRWKFLFFQYRPDVHWWSLVLMARAVILNLGIITVQESATKLCFILAVLMVYVALLSVCRPWRHRINNLVDGLTQFCLIAVASLFTRYAVETTDLDYVMDRFTHVAFIFVLMLSALLCWSMVWSHIRWRSMSELRQEELDKIILAFRSAERAKKGDFEKFIEGLGEWDAMHMRIAKNIVMTEFCKVASRQGLSSQDLSRRIGSEKSLRLHSAWRGTVDWNVVDANVGRFSTASYGSNDALPNRVSQALELVQGVSRDGVGSGRSS